MRTLDLILILGGGLYAWAMLFGAPVPPTQVVAAVAFWGYTAAHLERWRREGRES
jgi:hypothetical protein